LREWFSKKDWDKWDREIEADFQSGKLNLLVKEAKDSKNYGKLKVHLNASNYPAVFGEVSTNCPKRSGSLRKAISGF